MQNNYSLKRFSIVATIFIAVICNYLDRQLLSILKPEILDHFGIGDSEYAWIVNVFLICYAIMYPISGFLVDKFGPKPVMFSGIAVWSLACIGGGLSQDVFQFTVCRGFLGLAEPTIFAGQIVAVTVWFEKRQRATANSICQAGGSLGSVVAPLVIAWLSKYFPWNEAFVIAGAAGLVIAVVWFFVYSNPPKEVLALTIESDTKEAAAKEDAPAFTWGGLWKTKSLYGCLLIRLLGDPVWYFCCFWLPGFLRSMGEAQGLSNQETLSMIQWIGGIPFLIGAIGGVLSSMWSDKMVRKGMNSLKSRRIMMTSMVVFGPLCMLTPFVSNWTSVDFGVRLIIVTAIFSLVAVLCLSWIYTIGVVIAEAFPAKNVGSVFSIACGAGAVGGAVFNIFVASLLESLGSVLFIIMGCLHVIAAVVLWKMVRKETPKTSQI